MQYFLENKTLEVSGLILRNSSSRWCWFQYSIFLFEKEAKLSQLANETKLELNDIKASISTLNFIFLHSTTHNVNSDTLNFELQQLGLPKGYNLCFINGCESARFSNFWIRSEHAKSICKNYEDFQQRLHEFLRDSSIRRMGLTFLVSEKPVSHILSLIIFK